MKTSTPESMKFRRLQRRLGVSRAHLVGILELLWIATSKNAPQGDIGRFSNEEIAIECDFEGNPDELVNALLDCGWLDKHDECRLVVHDWADHCPNHVHANLKRWGKPFIVAPKDSTKDSPRETPRDAPLDDAPTKPSLAKPSQAMPNLAKPSHAKPNEGASGVAGGRADFDFLKLGEERYRDVVRQSVAINNAFGKQIESAELVWKLAWVGYACSEGTIPTCIEKFRKLKNTPQAVKNPQAWLIGCINRELKDSGLCFEDASQFVVPFADVKAMAT